MRDFSYRDDTVTIVLDRCVPLPLVINDPRTRKRYYRDMIKGVSYLKTIGVIHVDIKPSNMLLCDDVVQLADFGMSQACVMSDRDTFTHVRVAGSRAYLAPEVDLRGRYTFQVDVWSLGVVMLQLELTPVRGSGWLPAYGCPLNMSLHEHIRTSIPSITSSDLRLIIDRMLHMDPKTRPHIEVIRI